MGLLLRLVRLLNTRKRNFAILLLALCSLAVGARMLLAKPTRRAPSALLLPPTVTEAPRDKPVVAWDRLQHEVDDRHRVAPPLSDEDRRVMPQRCSHHYEDEEPLNVDDQGRICTDANMDPESGCCVPSLALAQHSCAHCIVPPEPKNPEAPHQICCAVFVDCISCCMASQIGRPMEGSISGRFRRCVNRCRTSSRSLAEDGHSYKYGENHHCFHTRAELHTLAHYEAESTRFHAELAHKPY